MLIDRYPLEDVFACVPELADQTDPVLVQLDALLEDDLLFAQGRADLVRRHRLTAIHGRHSTPAEANLAPAHRQAPLRVELPGNRGARGR